LTYSGEKERLKHQIEDAENALDNAYLEVDPNEIQTNAQQESFKLRYWQTIDVAEAKLNSLNKKLESLEEKHTNTLKDINEQISKRKARIAKINK
jgi:chromosome segregation ATPase